MASEKSKNKNYTPQQLDFARRYYLMSSPTYGNAMQSAIDAGFSEKTAKNMTVKGLEWMKNIQVDIGGGVITKESLVKQAKVGLEKSLRSEDEKIVLDASKFTLKTTAEFSEKTDLTSNGETVSGLQITFGKFGKDEQD